MLVRSSGQPMRRWQKLPCHSLLAHPTCTTVSFTFPTLLTTDPWSPQILSSLSSRRSFLLSEFLLTYPIPPKLFHTVPRHTGLSHSVFPLRSTLNSHGLSMLQESSNRSLQSQTNHYSYQALAISSWPWPPGALLTRAPASTGSWVWHLLQFPAAGSPALQLRTPTSHQHFPSLTPHQSRLHLLPPFSAELKVHFLLGDSKAWIGICLEGSQGKTDVQQPCPC